MCLNQGQKVSMHTSHWEKHVHKLSAYAKQQPVGDYCMNKGIFGASAQSVPYYDETLDDDNYQLSLSGLPDSGTHDSSPPHPSVARGGTWRLSHCDWYEVPVGHLHLLPCPGRRCLAFRDSLSWTPVRPYSQVHLT